jgi:transposase
MRSAQVEPLSLLCYVTLDDRIPISHPARTLRTVLSLAFEKANKAQPCAGHRFERNSRIFHAMALQQAYEIESDRSFLEHTNYNILFRWFIGFTLNERIWNETSYRNERTAFVGDQKSISIFQGKNVAEEIQRFRRTLDYIKQRIVE